MDVGGLRTEIHLSCVFQMLHCNMNYLSCGP